MKHLTIERLAAFFNRHPRVQILDVRFAFEREAGHMVGDHHVSWYTLDGDPNPAFLKQVLRLISPDDPVLVICHSGHRACEAAALLEMAGFKYVYNVLGGYADIREMPAGHGCYAGLMTQASADQSTVLQAPFHAEFQARL